MLHIIRVFCFLFFCFSSIGVFAATGNITGETQVVVPEEIDWTERFILTELKELRVDIEELRRNVYKDINDREIEAVDRALSYSANTVNFFFVVLTIALAGLGIFGWRTTRDIKENLKYSFEKEVQKRVSSHQKQLENFIKEFQAEQIKHGEEILKNQEQIQIKQEVGYLWSQFNREEGDVKKLELIDKISAFDMEENTFSIYLERSNIYITLGLWEKSLEAAEKGLEIASEDTTLLYNKALSLLMLEDKEGALKVLQNICIIEPGFKEEILLEEDFSSIMKDIQKMIVELDSNK